MLVDEAFDLWYKIINSISSTTVSLDLQALTRVTFNVRNIFAVCIILLYAGIRLLIGLPFNAPCRKLI